MPALSPIFISNSLIGVAFGQKLTERTLVIGDKHGPIAPISEKKRIVQGKIFAHTNVSDESNPDVLNITPQTMPRCTRSKISLLML